MDNGTAPAPGFLQTYGPLILIFIILVLGILMRRRRPKSRLEIAIGLLSDVNKNMKIADAFAVDWHSARKFKTGIWKKYQAKLDFFNTEVQSNLSSAFNLAMDFNQRIDEAKQHKSAGYLAGIAVDKIKEPLSKSKQGLAEWIQANFQTEMARSRRGGLFGGGLFR